jgi:23S rRNA pseudouridine955/2504/2580 synthase
MFLHAHRLTITHPLSGERVTYDAALAPELTRFLDSLAAPDASAV